MRDPCWRAVQTDALSCRKTRRELMKRWLAGETQRAHLLRRESAREPEASEQPIYEEQPMSNVSSKLPPTNARKHVPRDRENLRVSVSEGRRIRAGPQAARIARLGSSARRKSERSQKLRVRRTRMHCHFPLWPTATRLPLRSELPHHRSRFMQDVSAACLRSRHKEVSGRQCWKPSPIRPSLEVLLKSRVRRSQGGDRRFARYAVDSRKLVKCRQICFQLRVTDRRSVCDRE